MDSVEIFIKGQTWHKAQLFRDGNFEDHAWLELLKLGWWRCAFSERFLLTLLWLFWIINFSWWRHQIETSSALQALCPGNSPVTGEEFPSQSPVAWSFHVFFDLCLNKRLIKQSWGWWFETPSCPLWHHCNVMCRLFSKVTTPVLKPVDFKTQYVSSEYENLAS